MSLQDTIAKDLLIIESDLGNRVITWDGSDYICIVGASVESADLGIGGFGGDTITPIFVRKNLFGDGVYPVKAEPVTLDSIQYEINKVTNDATGVFLRLELLDPHP